MELVVSLKVKPGIAMSSRDGGKVEVINYLPIFFLKKEKNKNSEDVHKS